MATWATILLFGAVVLLVAESLLPSAGLLGVGSALCLIGGIICLFQIDMTLGLVGVVGALILVPVALLTMMRMLPHTSVGRLLMLRTQAPDSRELVLDPARDLNRDKLVGASGTAVTGLRPVGICLIDGHRLECVSETGMIESGCRVTVTAVHGLEVKVRQA